MRSRKTFGNLCKCSKLLITRSFRMKILENLELKYCMPLLGVDFALPGPVHLLMLPEGSTMNSVVGSVSDSLLLLWLWSYQQWSPHAYKVSGSTSLQGRHTASPGEGETTAANATGLRSWQTAAKTFLGKRNPVPKMLSFFLSRTPRGKTVCCLTPALNKINPRGY